MQTTRKKLLRLFAIHGDHRYKEAAEKLEPTLLDRARQTAQPRSPNREASIGPRVTRMAQANVTGPRRLTPYRLAVNEVAEHGRGEFASADAAITQLRRVYTRQARGREQEARYLLDLDRRNRALNLHWKQPLATRVMMWLRRKL